MTGPERELPEPFASLSPDAKAVAAAFFGTWTAASGSSLRFGMVRSRPTDRARAALDEAEAAGIVSAERSKDGSVTYRPRIDCTPLFRWNFLRREAGDVEDIRLTEPIPAGEGE